MPSLVIRSIVAIGTLVLAVSAVGAAETDAPVSKPEVKVGDSWTYRWIDYVTTTERTTFKASVTFVGADVILLVSTFPKQETSDLERDSSWTSEWNARGTSTGRVYQPHSGMLRFPLKPGATYETKFELAAQRGSTVHTKYEATVKVVGWEDVVVPAGKFRALKVEARGTFQRLDISAKGWIKQDFWYVPEVKRWVKWTFGQGNSSRHTDNGHELVEFDVQR